MLLRTVHIACPAALALLAGATALAADAVSFNRDIRPILADNCYQCHGPDPGSRKADLRFDRDDGFFGERDGDGPTVIKGQPEKSVLFERLTTKDEDEVMPPPKSHKKLKPEQIALVRQWIEQGAPWQPHWSFVKPERAPVAEQGNPIDGFVRQKLTKAGLTPAAEADRRSLARRVSYDLIGLPPEPEWVEAFVADEAPGAYERLVDKLMAMPQYGEHRARYWLDAARYADTHGLHFDNFREMWAYRDWVINAFNRNQPFDQFTVEQVAGDLLPKPTRDQLIATGFHRCNITTNEGGTIAEENLANYARDRVETTSWVWLGLTANCAVCHDHKFDPVTTKDFYAMSAFFRNTTQSDKDGNIRNTAPVLVLPEAKDAPRWDALPGEIASAKAKLDGRRKALDGEFQTWLTGTKADEAVERTPDDGLVLHLPLTEGQGAEVKGIVDGAERKFTATAAPTWRPDGKAGPAPRLSKEATLDLGDSGNFERDQPFSFSLWLRPSSGGQTAGSALARMDSKTNGYRGWDLFVSGGEFAVHFVHQWPGDALKVSTTGKQAKAGEWRHVAVTYDGSGKAAGVNIFVNGRKAKTRSDKDALKNTMRTSVSLRLGQRAESDSFEGNVQDVRLYTRALIAAEARQLSTLPEVRTLLAKTDAQRTPEEKAKLREFFDAGDEELAEISAEIASLETEKNEIAQRSAVTHIQEERMDTPPMARLLYRGQYDQPRDEVKPAVFAALHPMPADAPPNRLGLAKWLVSPENPLTARVIVNRYWQEIFGTGIVRTAEDFGIMSEPPSHSELLDWLAVEFRESGWDVKRLIRLMVTSATYRQSATATPEKIERDPGNRLLSRGPRFRMDAEMIRDTALATSGLLVKKIGGPSVKPYQPDGVWEAVAMPESNTRQYQRDAAEALYRRSLYTFWKRAAPPASLEIFNAPSREFSCVRRERTNTPLQALATLNDPQFIEAARVLAQGALRFAPDDPEKALDWIGRRLLARSFRAEEIKVLITGERQLLTHYEQKPEDAQALLAVGESKRDPAIPVARLAAWTMLCNQLMNLDEVLNK